MPGPYDWEEPAPSASRSERQGGYWLVAIVLALGLHFAFVLWGVNKVLSLDFVKSEEWTTRPLPLQQIEISPQDIQTSAPPDVQTNERRPEEGGALVEEVEELLPELQNVEIDISTEVTEAALPKMEIEAPVLAGVESGELEAPVTGPDVAAEIPELGQIDNLFPTVKAGQLIVDSGAPLADILDPQVLAKEMGRMKGAGGLSASGVMEGYTGLEAYARMSPGELERNKASIGSDLLFAFDKATLRPEARNTLMTVAMLIERNPEMYCWLEGHTDTIGSASYNLALSQRRAEAVRDWLIRALHIGPERIVVRAYGMEQPIILEGDQDAQAPNRRVDVKMRKNPPKAKPLKVLVKPGRAVLVVEDDLPQEAATPENAPSPSPRPTPLAEQPIPRAVLVEEPLEPLESLPPTSPVPTSPTEEIPRAIPVEEDPEEIPRAVLVEDEPLAELETPREPPPEEIPRAEPVEEPFEQR